MKQSKLQQFFKKPGPPDETDKRQENPNKPTEELHEVTEVQTGINPDSRANLGSDKNSKNCNQDMISLGEESGSSTESSESEESDSDDECVDERMNVKAKPKKKKTHYKHKFNSDWLSDKDLQKWIRKDEKDSTRFMCLVCNKSYIGGKTHALRHSKNKFHVKNFEAKQHTTDLANLCSSNVEFKKSVMLQKSVENAELKLSGFIAEHNLPFRVMEHLPGILKNVFPDSVIAGKITCGRDKTRNIIVKKLAPDADQALSEKLQKYKFSILLDESTDKSVVKSMAVVARFWCPQLKRVCDRLLGLVEVPSATAQIMKGEVDKLLSVRNIPKENCIGFGWDNASVNMGEVTGLKALVKIDNPYVIVVGCVCHSLAPCASNASKEIPLEFDEFVRDVYNYIQHSPKRIAAYAEFQGITDTKNHRLLKVCDVRWLSLESVVMRILEQWRALKVYFYEEFKAIKSASAEKVLKMMENVYTKLYLQFLGFILPQVNKLNILFQAEGVRLHCLCNEVSTVFGTILRNFLRPEVWDINLANIDAEAISFSKSLSVNPQKLYRSSIIQDDDHKKDVALRRRVAQKQSVVLKRSEKKLPATGQICLRQNYEGSSLTSDAVQFQDRGVLYKFTQDSYLDDFSDEVPLPSREEIREAETRKDDAISILLKKAPDAVLRAILRKHPEERTEEDVEAIYEELVHISSLSHLSTSIKRELASVIAFESHPKPGTICKLSRFILPQIVNFSLGRNERIKQQCLRGIGLRESIPQASSYL
ncbi:hypothetical protein QYM36_012322 [Artemia franciscana]|uniref:Uncharacterized protein n=1 Tax=Artemia franciscana TaxID=6661 RepID=A0AA88L7P4_ARTSF|nr:hypothetical protein QYM36_012322 [Artemia franciscana]